MNKEFVLSFLLALCVVGGSPEQACYDGFGVDLPSLGTDWKAYRIPFASLSPRNFGLHGIALDTTSLYDMAFIFPSGVVFDLWVDDIRFF